MDFEQTLIVAYHEIFEETKLNGCIFCLSQSIWRNVQSCGFVGLYNLNPIFKTIIKMLIGGVFCETDLIRSSLAEIFELACENNLK
jgi:hypothetical protein